ncbi:N-acetylmuramoyl-L-alanine amidase [Roseivivax sp. CAU 1761]
MHYTAMQSAEAARDLLSSPEAQVSAHYLIARDGRIWQLVDEGARAWHAGAGRWGGIDDMNSRSIGIELDNDGVSPFAAPLMDALEALLPGILARWRIAPARVIGHSDMAPGRKIDPGPRFDWARLARAGLAIRPEPRAPGEFWRDAARFGYDPAPELRDAVLAAFRMRFRPRVAGPLDRTDAALMADLAARWPAAEAAYSTS